MLHGRQAESERIDTLLGDARAGEGGALLVLGDPGVGKTALLAAAARGADGMRRVGAVGLEAESALPFSALAEMTEDLRGWIGELPAPQAAAIEGALAVGPPAPGDRFAVCAGFLGLLTAAAAEQPLLVSVDDAQWLDPASAECVGFAARRLKGKRIAMLLAAREEPQALSGDRIDHLALSGLDREAARALLADVDPTLPRNVADSLMEAGAGNPLALIELHGVLTEEQRRGTEAVSEPLPPGVTLQGVFERRVSRLPESTREALLVAAASFTSSLEPVLAACGTLGIEPDALEPAEDEGIVRISSERIEFGHPLLRGAVYRGGRGPDSRRAHRALSEHTDEDSRSWHLAAAAIEPDAAVADALAATARRASSRGAYAAAADALERAARLSDDAEARSRRLLGAGVAAATGGAYERGVALMELAKEIDDPSTRAAVNHRLGLVTLNGGVRNSGDTYAMLTEEAGRIAPIDPAAAAAIYADAGVAAAIAGNCELVLTSAQRAADVMPPDADAPTRGQVHSILGLGLILRGRTAEGRDNLDTAGGLLADVDPLSPAAQTIAFALGARRCTGQERLLREEAESLERAAREAGAEGLFPYYGVLVADGAFRSGDWEATERGIAEAIEGAQESGQLASLAIALAISARLHAAKGEEERARAEVARSAEISERPGYGNPIAWGKAALGGLALALGRVEEAIEELELVQRLLEVGGLEDPLVVPWAPDLVEAYAAAGRMEDAARIVGIMDAQADRNGTPLAAALAAHCEGVVVPDSFDRAFERALGLHDGGEWPFERARALLAFGSRLHRARRRTEARERLRAALEGFEQLGAAAWAGRAKAELRAAGAIKREPVGDPDALTAQEARVAQAVARGATNREVAAELFLSPKTIEFHLGRVYRKLGIKSRTELAALAAEGRLQPGVDAGLEAAGRQSNRT